MKYLFLLTLSIFSIASFNPVKASAAEWSSESSLNTDLTTKIVKANDGVWLTTGYRCADVCYGQSKIEVSYSVDGMEHDYSFNFQRGQLDEPSWKKVYSSWPEYEAQPTSSSVPIIPGDNQWDLTRIESVDAGKAWVISQKLDDNPENVTKYIYCSTGGIKPRVNLYSEGDTLFDKGNTNFAADCQAKDPKNNDIPLPPMTCNGNWIVNATGTGCEFPPYVNQPLPTPNCGDGYMLNKRPFPICEPIPVICPNDKFSLKSIKLNRKANKITFSNLRFNQKPQRASVDEVKYYGDGLIDYNATEDINICGVGLNSGTQVRVEYRIRKGEYKQIRSTANNAIKFYLPSKLNANKNYQVKTPFEIGSKDFKRLNSKSIKTFRITFNVPARGKRSKSIRNLILEVTVNKNMKIIKRKYSKKCYIGSKKHLVNCNENKQVTVKKIGSYKQKLKIKKLKVTTKKISFKVEKHNQHIRLIAKKQGVKKSKTYRIRALSGKVNYKAKLSKGKYKLTIKSGNLQVKKNVTVK